MLIGIAVGYLVLINVVTYIAVGHDKSKARRGVRRTAEKTLFLLALLGGIWGLIGGMRHFRHKTAKGSFLFVTTLLFVINLAYYVLLIQVV